MGSKVQTALPSTIIGSTVLCWHEVVGRWPLVTPPGPEGARAGHRQALAQKSSLTSCARATANSFPSRLARRLTTQRYFDSAAEVERQRGETRRWIIVLARQVLDGRVKLKVPVETIAAADVDLRVSRGQVAVRKKHSGSKR